MARPLTAMFGFYISTPGRRIYALTRVGKLAKARDLPDIVAETEEAIAHDRKVLELDAARLVARGKNKPKSRLREHDSEVDGTLVIIDRVLGHHAGRGDQDAAALSSTLFPISVAHHVQLAFVEQAAANERVLDVLEDPARKPWLVARGLWPFTEQLRTAHDVFAAALELRDSTTAPTWPEVRAAREQGQELYLGVVALIAAQFRKDPVTRDELLEPVWAQNQLIQQIRRERRGLVDVDPESGEPLTDADADAGAGEVEASEVEGESGEG